MYNIKFYINVIINYLENKTLPQRSSIYSTNMKYLSNIMHDQPKSPRSARDSNVIIRHGVETTIINTVELAGRSFVNVSMRVRVRVRRESAVFPMSPMR